MKEKLVVGKRREHFLLFFLLFNVCLSLSYEVLLFIGRQNYVSIDGINYLDGSLGTNSNNLPFAATAMILGMPITLLEGNACDHLRLGSCPALIGHGFTFSVNFDVPMLLPPVYNF